MARPVSVTVHAEYVDVDLELWCLTCNLATGARVWFTTATGGHTTLRSAMFCTECRGRNIVP